MVIRHQHPVENRPAALSDHGIEQVDEVAAIIVRAEHGKRSASVANDMQRDAEWLGSFAASHAPKCTNVRDAQERRFVTGIAQIAWRPATDVPKGSDPSGTSASMLTNLDHTILRMSRKGLTPLGHPRAC
jgi:hypothetical protein